MMNSWAIVNAVESCLASVAELWSNTVEELKLLISSQYSGISSLAFLTNQDVRVLFTACFSLFGLMFAFGIIDAVFRFCSWLCFGDEVKHSAAANSVGKYSPEKILESKRWFRQAWNDFLAARNDFEADTPAPEWVCYKTQQALEKGLKALLILQTDKIISTHDICELASLTGNTDLCKLSCQVQGIVGLSSRTRYPDMLPAPKTPRDAYSLSDSVRAHELGNTALSLIKQRIHLLTS